MEIAFHPGNASKDIDKRTGVKRIQRKKSYSFSLTSSTSLDLIMPTSFYSR